MRVVGIDQAEVVGQRIYPQGGKPREHEQQGDSDTAFPAAGAHGVGEHADGKGHVGELEEHRQERGVGRHDVRSRIRRLEVIRQDPATKDINLQSRKKMPMADQM